MASPIPQNTLDGIKKTRGVLSSVKVFLDGEAARRQAAIDAALALGATEAQLAPIQEELDGMSAQADEVAAAIAANP